MRKPKRFNSFRKKKFNDTRKDGYRLVHIIQPGVLVWFITMSGNMLVTTTDYYRASWFKTRDDALSAQDAIFRNTSVTFEIV